MVLDRLSRLAGRARRELVRTDRVPGPAFWGTRESLALGLALIVFGTLGAGLWGLTSAAHVSLLSGTRTAAQRQAAPARLVQSASGTFVYPGGSPDLVWPSAGSAAVEVVGYGLMGEKGSLDRQASIASITKTMTAYVVLKDHPLGASESGPTITLTSEMAAEYGKAIDQDESAVQVRTGEQLTERQALEAMMLASAGDMADILAIWDAGSVDAFLVKMNKQARALGMTRSDYTDPTGLAASTVSTIADQLKLAEAVQKVPALTSIVAESDASVPVAGTVHNYNEDLGEYGIDGIKTGTTAAAGSCLLFSAHYTVDGKTVTILGIVLGLAGSTGTPWSALTAAGRLVDSAEHALGTATVAAAGQTVARVEQTGSDTRQYAPAAAVKVFGWAGLEYRVAVGGTAAAPRLRVTRTGATGDAADVPLHALPHRASLAGSTVRKPESRPSTSK
ncbi:D-alanyl-D-alanine carboxypeptidase [Actinospica durhamensis]|uniref:D-alanyl-D-alanine carboxypeptidase n=1 Tax=Actinospica durhamensis TaxID=1508375 RepID=A0A941ESN4_9ACTN|nr:D-alanyl-D-alanine carboxypeptidase [Actinospica durhamensis]MBR7836453.1 D-alanyl-D-alanine carboxypeptidase [Actinospica durhamensis]